jgi:IS605 OrfB family transposase
MNQVLTVSCKLNPSSEQASKIDATLNTFAETCAWINQQTPPQQRNALRMQAQRYHQARALFGLSANLTQQAFRRVAANRKTARLKGRTVKGFAATSIQYDARIFSFNQKNWSVSLTLLGGRGHIPLAIGNYQRHLHHQQKLVYQAKHKGWGIALEDLNGIRARTNQQPRSKTERRRSNSWAFFQLRRFLAYKAIRAGVPLVLVNPAHTSKTCHCCYRIGERQGKGFCCWDGCGWSGDADYNAACVLSVLGASVILPRGPWMACHLEGFQNFLHGFQESPPCSGSAA